MGNHPQARQEPASNEAYLSDVQHYPASDLMFQSKLSTSSVDTKLTRKIIIYGSA